MKNFYKSLSILALQFCGASALAQGPVAIVYSGDGASGTKIELPAPSTYAMDSSCGPQLGVTSLGFRPRSIKLADGYQARIQGWYNNPGDDFCRGPSSLTVPPTCVAPKNIYDPGCLNSWVYTYVGGAIIVEAQSLNATR